MLHCRGLSCGHFYSLISAKVRIGSFSCISYHSAVSGIKEVQIIQWFVEPGARVEQFDKICEVQSDKATTEVFEAKQVVWHWQKLTASRSHPGLTE